MPMQPITTLTEAQTQELYELYQHEWWTQGRTLADVQKMLAHAQLIFAFEDDGHLGFSKFLDRSIFIGLKPRCLGRQWVLTQCFGRIIFLEKP